MSKTIVQKVVFKNASAKDLFELYTDSKKHSLVTGGPAEITDKDGDEFTFHDKYITGKNMQVVKNQLIVQTWRATDWKETDPDSTCLIHLETKDEDVILHMVHANVPDENAENLEEGWKEYYWKPWKKYLAGKFK